MKKIHAALALGALLCLGAAGAPAQTAKGSPEHIKAATQRVDGAFIRANAAKTPDWPSYGLDYAETRFSKLDQVNAGNVKDLGLVWSYNLAIHARRRGHAAGGRRHHVRHRLLERGARDRRAHRQAALDLRPEGRPREAATRAAATWSTAAWRSTRARSSSAPTTAG